mmetsp:Transcript_23168/g.29756  ORF Transcript_23168/g.29756 Transcript_23168/m.29756 type:complete len:98 (+) Transcript_23168:482-775(+)
MCCDATRHIILIVIITTTNTLDTVQRQSSISIRCSFSLKYQQVLSCFSSSYIIVPLLLLFFFLLSFLKHTSRTQETQQHILFVITILINIIQANIIQ